jgi:hypothetical protein
MFWREIGIVVPVDSVATAVSVAFGHIFGTLVDLAVAVEKLGT